MVCTLLFVLISLTVGAQDYIVKTSGQSGTKESEERTFVVSNFPYYSICDWKAGQKFMFVPEERYSIMPLLKAYENGRDVNNGKLQHKIFEFIGIEEIEKESYTGKTFLTHLVFESEGEKYYHEMKFQHLTDVCANNPRALINNLVYLADVDVARELLDGRTLYLKVDKARVDDASGGSYREVNVAKNLEVTVTAVGVGTRECPVKIVFQDRDGNSYYRNVILSGTNSGLLETDLVGANFDKSFSNVFSFTDRELRTNEDIKKKYVGQTIYPKETIEAVDHGRGVQVLLRYTPLVVKDIELTGSGTEATLKLSDRKGGSYTILVDMKYDIFIRNENYINDMFGYGDLRSKYPYISEENWNLLGNGEVKIGMTRDECRLSLGPAIQIVKNPNSRYETWYYRGRVLEFEGNNLLHIK